MNNILQSETIMEERFVAFLDILGFTEAVKRIEKNNNPENNELRRVKSILNFMSEETTESNYSADLPIYVKKGDELIEYELGDPRLTYVSDCIIISAEPTLDGFKGLSRKIHKITADLASDGFFCRGAITKGKLFHRDKVLFGSSYIKAYELEEKIAKVPRVIIDPDIIDFFELTGDEVPLAPAFFGKDIDGLYYQRYWTWFLYPPHAGSYETYLMTVRSWLMHHLKEFKGNENILFKYRWLQNEFNNLISLWREEGLIHIENIEEHDINQFKITYLP
jgi:hypothetical protein